MVSFCPKLREAGQTTPPLESAHRPRMPGPALLKSKVWALLYFGCRDILVASGDLKQPHFKLRLRMEMGQQDDRQMLPILTAFSRGLPAALSLTFPCSLSLLQDAAIASLTSRGRKERQPGQSFPDQEELPRKGFRSG